IMSKTTIEKIRHRIGDELAAMNDIIRTSLSTSDPLMGRVVDQYLRTKGKQIRPLLVLLSARLFGDINDSTLHAAASLEMLHNATLIHDDVVDNADFRRQTPTINKDFDNRIAVLVGDFFVSTALQEAIKTKDMKAVVSVAELGKELSLGEIDQISNARDRSIDEDRYFDVIGKKTASLFMKCVKMGSETTDATDFQIECLVEFARLLGLCFQIKDDIFDYFDDEEVGKPTGNDLRENKVSLPLIYAVNAGSNGETGEKMRALLVRGELDENEISVLIDFAKENGGIDYAYSVMDRMRDEAEEILQKLPANEWRDCFADLFDFTIRRHS
ncbi:MAG: polyprenyl synthetase family protein, partial [Muribaculaceae bacterium]|nr:polyprenyl synthetase family protein [Muribaculaceae bacterium]